MAKRYLIGPNYKAELDVAIGLSKRRSKQLRRSKEYFTTDDVLFLINTGVDVDTGNYTARRMIYTSVGGAIVWEMDEEDETVYQVLIEPGTLGMFVGCRFRAELVPEADVYIPVRGECYGFSAVVNGAPIDGGSGEEYLKYYPWQQQWTTAANRYYSGLIVQGHTLSKALLLSSLARDPQIVDWNEVPSGTPVFMWWADSIGGGAGGFVFEVGCTPVYDVCEGAAR